MTYYDAKGRLVIGDFYKVEGNWYDFKIPYNEVYKEAEMKTIKKKHFH